MADIYKKALKNAEKLKKAQLTAVANNKVTLPKAKSTSSSTKSSTSGTKSTVSGNNSTKKTLTKRKGTTNNKHKLSEGAKKIQQEAIKTKAVPQALVRFNEKIINDVALAPVSIPYQIKTGKKLADFGLEPTTDSAKIGATVGGMAGDIASYGSAYKAAGKATTKAAEKLLATNAGKKAVAKAAATKTGQKLGKEAVENKAKSLARNTVADLTVGATLNLSRGRGEGLEGGELGKYMLENAALDLGIGGAIEALPWAVKALKNTKLSRQVAKGAKVADAAPSQKAAQTGNLAPENPLPDANKFNAKTISDEQNEYLEDLAARIKSADSKAAPTTRKQTNKTVGKVQTAGRNTAKAESETLFDEYVKVSKMTPEEFADYIGKGAVTVSDTATNAARETFTPKVGDLTPEAKAKIYKTVEDRSGTKVVEENLPDGIDGFYQDGVIHINANAANPQYTVLKHELTHHLQSSDMYEDFSKFIFKGLQERGEDLATLRAAKKSQYSEILDKELSDAAVDEELIADFCGEVLFSSEKSIERLARENPNLFVRIYEWIVDTIKKLGADDKTKFLIDAQRKYEKALRTAKADVTGEAYPLFVRAAKEEQEVAEAMEKAGATPEQIKQQTNLHRGFKDDWLYEVDDSGARINEEALARGGNIEEVLDHPELWDRMNNVGKKNHRINEYTVKSEKLDKGTEGVTRPSKAEIALNDTYPKSDRMTTLLHETQHAIQKKGHLPSGTSLDAAEIRLRSTSKEFRKLVKDFDIAVSGVKKKIDEIVREAQRYNSETAPKLFTAYNRDKTLLECLGDYYDRACNFIINGDQTAKELFELADKLEKASDLLMEAEVKDYEMNGMVSTIYRNTAGEIESRDVERRMKMTAEERRNTMPARKDKNTVFAEDKFFSTGGGVFRNDKLREVSENLYGEKGNKYKVKAETPPEGVKTASKPLPTKEQKKAEPVKVKTGNTGKPLPKKEAPKVEVKGAKSVSADAKKHEMTYEEAVKAYGAYKNGTPKSLDGVGDVSKAADTILGSELTNDKTAEAMRESLSSYVKVTKSNKTTIANANARIDDIGLNGALKKFNDTLKSGKRFNEEDIAMGAELYGALNAKGKTDQALDIAEDVIEMLSQTGRTFQAARIFASLTPYGRMRSIKIAAERMSERYGKNITVGEDLMKKLFEATDEGTIDKIKKEIFTKLWNQVPSGFFEKLDAIRYTAMLSSPKTHLRNIFGNGAMFIGKEISDIVQTGLEKSVFKGKMDRLGADSTKAILNPFSKSDKELLSKAGELFDELKDGILNSSSKYIEKSGRRPQDSQIFKRKTLEGARKLVSGTLEKEDEIAMRIAFKNAFAKMCKANGLEVGELTAKEVRQYTAYATRQAQQATFRDPNALASALNKVYNYALDTSKSDFAGKLGKGALKVGMDATIPFIKTPSNILKQGWRYSPGGVLEGITRCASAKNADELMKGIEILSNGVVGTPIVLIGTYLASKGYVTGDVGDYSDKTAKFKRMTGEQDYSLIVDGKSITLDWLSPYSMPFFVGVALGEDYPESESLSATQLVDALASITNPFLEMSMMSGVQDLLTQNYDENAAQTIAFNTLSTYLTQYVPTVVSQIAKTVAETTTTTSSVNDGTITGRFVSSTGAKLKGKVPGLYSSNQPDVDVWGRTETKEDMWDYIDAGLRNIISPANIKDMNLTDVDKELLKVYDALDDEKSAVIPTPAKSKISYNNIDYQMTNEEFTAYKKDLGKYRYEKLQQLIKTSDYKMSNAKVKSEKIQAVYDEATAEAKKNYLINSGKMTKEEYALSTLGGENENKKLKAAIKAGKIKATEVYDAKNLIKESGAATGAAEAYVLANSGMSARKVALLTSDGSYEKAKDLKRAGATEKDVIKASQTLAGHGNDKAARQAYMLLASGQSKAVTSALTSDTAINRAYAIRRANITPDQLDTVAKKIDTDNSGTYTNKELTAYLSGANMTQAQKHAVFEALKANPKTANPY